MPNDTGTDVQRHDRLAGRVDVLESTMTDIKASIRDSADANERNFTAIYNTMDSIKTSLASSGKMNWPLMVAIVSVALTMCVLFSGFVVMQVRPVEKQTEEQRQALSENQRWHLDAVATTARTDERILQNGKIIEQITGRIDRNYAEMQVLREEVARSRENVAALTAKSK